MPSSNSFKSLESDKFVPELSKEFVKEYGEVPNTILDCLRAMNYIIKSGVEPRTNQDYNALDGRVCELMMRAEQRGEDVREHDRMREEIDKRLEDACELRALKDIVDTGIMVGKFREIGPPTNLRNKDYDERQVFGVPVDLDSRFVPDNFGYAGD